MQKAWFKGITGLVFPLYFIVVSCASAPLHSALQQNPDKTGLSAPGNESAESGKEEAPENGPERIAEPDAYYHYLLGNLYELEGNIPRAYFEFKSALILDPQSSLLKYEIATLAVREGDLKTAEEEIRSLLQTDPEHMDALALLGDIYANQGKSAEAIAAYQKLSALNPDFNDPYLEIASLYIKEKNYPEAERTIRKLIARKPNLPVGYYYLGRIAFEARAYKDAIAKYQEALKREGAYEPAWMGIGLVYETEGDLVNALKTYRKFIEVAGSAHREPRYRIVQILFQQRDLAAAKVELEELLKLDPGDIEGNFRLAVVFAEEKDYPKAIQLLNVAIEKRGNDPRLVDYLGSLYEANNQDDKAIVAYKTVIETDKSYTDAYVHLASVYMKSNQIEPALKTMEEARQANPQKEDILFSGTGWIYFQADRFDESMAAFNRAIAINPNNPDFHYNLGQVYDKLDRFDEMEKEMQKSIELEPGYVNALNYLGYSYAEKNIKLNEAQDLIVRALKVRPNDGFIIDSLAWVYYKKGELDKAASELKKALEFVPGDPTIHEHLGEVYYKKNIKQAAREEFLKSIEINPSNQKLIDRFKEYGLADPASDERIEKALKKSEPSATPDSNRTNQAESAHSKI